ncbi:MAG TPA: hypothetical protein VHS74_14860 [Solirubrobacterales bacterium]|jgi:hypothetical protein|nr:hypothetical protein [Solirubrobacterales bacterium]
MSLLTPDTSPARLLARLRGAVTDAHLTYPERIQVDVTDPQGGAWSLISWWADYSPTDPDQLHGKTVVDVGLDATGKVTVAFSDRSNFTITPVPDEGDDAIENWELFTPEGLVLHYGPWGRWHLKNATDPAEDRP